MPGCRGAGCRVPGCRVPGCRVRGFRVRGCRVPARGGSSKNCFLACKTAERKAPQAQAELTQSLQRLRTDYLDLYQLHAITDVEKDVDAVFAKGGAMEVFSAARKSGQIRHLGFSAHSEAAALASS